MERYSCRPCGPLGRPVLRWPFCALEGQGQLHMVQVQLSSNGLPVGEAHPAERALQSLVLQE